MASARKLPNLAILTNTIEGARGGLGDPVDFDPTRQIASVRLDSLRFDHQPREIVPEEALQQLIAENRAEPSTVLAALTLVAAEDSYYGEILEKIQGLARSIETEGVLQPIQVVRQRDRLVVRDGHRRCLASLLAKAEAIPAVEVTEPSELEGVARALIVNVQREDLTALEKGAALLRLALLVGRQLAHPDGDTSNPALSLDALLGGRARAEMSTDNEDVGALATTTVTGQSRALAAQVRDRVCAMVGLQPRSYYRLLALNRLTPEARAQARTLTENQLRPITSLAPDDQAEILDFARRRNLSSKEMTTLAGVARSGDRDAVRRVMARLSRDETPRQRTSVTWDALLHAVPKDLWQRCQALRAELEALPPDHRRARLDAMWEQDHLLLALRAEFGSIFDAHGYAGPGTALEE